jgi:predicted nucleic acid-binding protein
MKASRHFFLDTNVFAYTVDSSEPAKRNTARELVRLGVESGRGNVSYQVVQEFLNLAVRKFANTMKLQDAEDYFTNILRPMLSVHSSPALFHEALHIHARYKLSWYDSLIVAAALSAGCDTLYSEDLKNGLRIGSLTVRNPFAPTTRKKS